MEKSEAQNQPRTRRKEPGYEVGPKHGGFSDFGPMTAAKILWKAMPDAEDDNSITKEERDENSFESSSSEEEQCNITPKTSSGEEIDGLH